MGWTGGEGMTTEQLKAWRVVKGERRTKEDWLDLHRTLEAYKLRFLHRHQAKARSLGRIRTDAQ